MQDKDRSMYQLEYPSPEMPESKDGGTTLIVALTGYADAGLAVESSAGHLLAALDNRLVASFNADELIDYRSRRPQVTIQHQRVTDMDELSLDMRVMRDVAGHSFLLLSGPEPDMRWNQFTEAVAGLVDKYDVERTICLYSAPMTVPHTRPLVVSAHGNSPALTENLVQFSGTMSLPGSASLALEDVLTQRGSKVAGFTAHVPHYIAASGYPEATLRLLQTVSDKAGLDLPLRSLEADQRRVAEQLAEQLADSPEIQQVVEGLESQYDVEAERYRNAHSTVALPGEEDLPSGEEIGEEFERFLAEFDDDSSNSDSDSDADSGDTDE